MLKKSQLIIEKIVREIFDKMKIKISLEILAEKDLFKVNISSSDSALLIGYHGETLGALQHIINIIWQKQKQDKKISLLKSNRSAKIFLDINSYRNKQNQSLEEMAQKMAQRVLKYRRPEVLRPMNSYERRIIHLCLAGEKNIVTESVGEEPNRRIILRYKEKPKS